MAVLVPHAFAALAAVIGCTMYVLLRFPKVRERLAGGIGLRRARPTRRRFGKPGLEMLPVREAPAVNATRGKPSDFFAPIAADIQALHKIACICAQENVEVGSALGQIAELLVASTPRPAATSCRIEFFQTQFWSPGYVTYKSQLERTIDVGGVRLGSITLGAADPQSIGELEGSIEAGSLFIGQMLARYHDRQRLEEQRKELGRRQSILEQASRLVRMGAWEFDPKTSAFTWSDVVHRSSGTNAQGEAEPERENLMAAELRDLLEESVRNRKPINQELAFTQPNGRRRWLQAMGDIEFVDAEPSRVIGIVRDISEERETQHRLSNMANHDALTGLPNRRHFLERLDAALLTRGASGALILIDIDNFKDVNDTGGHDVGDALLKAFAKRLEEVTRGAVVARLGGDEFAVLLLDVQWMDAERRALSLLSKLREPLIIFGRRESVRLSAGLTTFPEDGRDATALLKNADLATYAAKARGRNSLVTYKSEIREASEWRVTVCTEVEAALAANQFVPFYQPKVSLKTGEIVGFEALLRWEHPKGIRTPGSILPAFDVPELSRAICSRMLDRIVIDMAHWTAQGLPFGRIAFNASAAEFDGYDLAGRVLRQLKSIGLPPSVLGLEVTETVFLGRDTDGITSALKQLHDAGVEIALDDFGTGYASLTHLQKFPVDVIKIDQSFIRGMITDSGSQAITSVVLGLGRSLGMKVVAEGVETAEQAKLLTISGCDQVQGYYFARPMCAADVPDFLKRWRGAAEIDDLSQKAA